MAEKHNPEENSEFQIEKRQSDGTWTSAEPVAVSDAGMPKAEVQPEQDEPVKIAGWEDEPRKAGKKKGSLKMVIAAAAAAIILLSAGGFSAYVYTYDKIFPGVTIGDEYKLAGMTQEEATTYINEECAASIMDSSVTLKTNGKEYPIAVADVAKTTDSTEVAAQAYKMGREGGFGQRISTVLGCMFGGREISYDLEISEKAVAKQVKAIRKEAYVEPIQPSFQVDAEQKKMTIDTGTPGIDFDADAAAAAVTEALRTLSFDKQCEIESVAVAQDKVDAEAMAEEATTEPKNAGVKQDGKTLIEAVDGIKVSPDAITKAVGDGSKQTYTLDVEANKATVTAAELEKVLFRDELASVTTSLNPGLVGRTTNVRLAMQAVNGTIVNPGETFSYNDIVGERTAARGYKSAVVFENGEQVPGLGGGVCQGSSTIYMAVLRADLKVTERRSHTFQVSYTPIAQDATVAWGSQDFKFVNNTDYPIKVVTGLSGSTVSCTLIGTKTQEKTVRLYASGAAYSNGYKHVSLYKEVTVNGKTTTTVENNSSYKIESD